MLPSWCRSGYSCYFCANSHYSLTSCISLRLPVYDKSKESQVHSSSTGTSLYDPVSSSTSVEMKSNVAYGQVTTGGHVTTQNSVCIYTVLSKYS